MSFYLKPPEPIRYDWLDKVLWTQTNWYLACEHEFSFNALNTYCGQSFTLTP